MLLKYDVVQRWYVLCVALCQERLRVMDIGWERGRQLEFALKSDARCWGVERGSLDGLHLSRSLLLSIGFQSTWECCLLTYLLTARVRGRVEVSGWRVAMVSHEGRA